MAEEAYLHDGVPVEDTSGVPTISVFSYRTLHLWGE